MAEFSPLIKLGWKFAEKHGFTWKQFEILRSIAVNPGEILESESWPNRAWLLELACIVAAEPTKTAKVIQNIRTELAAYRADTDLHTILDLKNRSLSYQQLAAKANPNSNKAVQEAKKEAIKKRYQRLARAHPSRGHK